MSKIQELFNGDVELSKELEIFSYSNKSSKEEKLKELEQCKIDIDIKPSINVKEVVFIYNGNSDLLTKIQGVSTKLIEGKIDLVKKEVVIILEEFSNPYHLEIDSEEYKKKENLHYDERRRSMIDAINSNVNFIKNVLSDYENRIEKQKK
jgi:hypothetical protein